VLKPLGGRVVVKPHEPEEVTKGGIVLPDTAKKKPRRGEVVAVGPGRLLDNGQRAPMEVSVGDVVVFSEFAGTEISMKSGDKYVILDEDAVLAIDESKVPAKAEAEAVAA
jgi:chaperonin GroES